jgi:hypothetical protein
VGENLIKEKRVQSNNNNPKEITFKFNKITNATTVS